MNGPEVACGIFFPRKLQSKEKKTRCSVNQKMLLINLRKFIITTNENIKENFRVTHNSGKGSFTFRNVRKQSFLKLKKHL